MDIRANLIVKAKGGAGLLARDPRNRLHYESKEQAIAATIADAQAVDRLQDMLFAEGKRALLVVLQGTDTSGKDGTIRGVFNTAGPLGVHVTSFRRPSEQALAHDYLWRVHRACPARGTIGIFNRSHYEDVLVVKVRKLAPADAIEQRYEQINAFEKMLSENGTTILKFMLHISKEEQRERLEARLQEPDKRWKFNPDDLNDRRLWDAFTEAYETALTRCSTSWAPWYVIPADRKWVRNAAVSAIVRQTLETMAPQYPQPDWDPATIKVV
jgi:PPK2 family polyphosphate:nucleotide phosphotransferase